MTRPLDSMEDTDLAEDSSVNHKVFGDKRRVQADTMERQMQLQMEQMKLTMEAEFKAKEVAMLEKHAVQSGEPWAPCCCFVTLLSFISNLN